MENDRRNNSCPQCGSQFLYHEGEEVCCTKCDWKEVAKRNADHKLPTIGEIKNSWC